MTEPIPEPTTPSLPAVYLLEDDPTQNRLYCQILERGGYRVTGFSCAKDFLAKLETAEIPAVILCDIVLPDLDGLTLAQRLEEDHRWCTVPMILMTASPTRDRVAFAQKLEVPPEGFLVKPVQPPAMLNVVRSLLSRDKPVYLLRELQRRKLYLRHSSRLAQEGVNKSLAGVVKAIEDGTNKIETARREVQSLRQSTMRLGRNAGQMGEQLERRRKQLEEEIGFYKQQLLALDASRAEQVMRRREIAVANEREASSLSEQIRGLFELVRLSGTAANAPSAEEDKSLAEPAPDPEPGAGLPPAADLEPATDLESAAELEPGTATSGTAESETDQGSLPRTGTDPPSTH